MAKSSKTKAKEAAWSSLSKAIRYSHAYDGWNCSCVTCGIVKPWKEQQAGHWIPRAQGLAVYFDVNNIHPQCFRCNINLGSNGPEYAVYMRETYGDGMMELLREKQRMNIKYSEQDYRDMKKHYDSEFKRMEVMRGDGVQGIIELVAWA